MESYPDADYDPNTEFPPIELIKSLDISSTRDAFIDHSEVIGFGSDVETHSNAEYTELRSFLADGGDRFGVSAVSFDLSEELVWMGNQGGHVTSYYGSEMEKYTSFQVHASNDIRQICTTDHGVLSLTKNSLHYHTRQGLHISRHESNSMEEMQCLLLTSPSSLLMGGHQDKIIELDLNQVKEIRQVDIGEPDCAIIRQHSRFVCTGATSGKVSLRDPATLRVEHTLNAHNGSLSDFDVNGNLLVTAGFSNRLGNMAVDRYLMVYDLRVMRAGAPIDVLLDPLLLRFVPAFVSRLAVVSQSGEFQLVDTAALSESSMYIYQVRTAGSMCLTFDTSSTCQALAFGDAGGVVHLFGTNDRTTFNPYSRRTEFSDSEDHIPAIHFDDELTPLASIPMPYGNANLLSDWPQEYTKVAYRRTPAVDPAILKTMKMVQSIGYAQNPGLRLRNQVPYKLWNNSSRQRQPSYSYSKDDGHVVVPKRYQKIEVKYSKMGTDDFDYNFYNRSSFSGLEGNLQNSYCNSMLQVLYFLDPLRAKLVGHLCEKEFCLSCELGFLFHMLDISKGIPCQANNFLRAFRTIPEASALDLILTNGDDDIKKINLSSLIQSWNRFILQQIHTDTLEHKNNNGESSGKSDADNPSAASTLFGMKMFNHNRCRCGVEKQLETTTLVFSLVYPDIKTKKTPTPCSFASVLKSSVCFEQRTQAWCESCGKYQPTTQNRRGTLLPDIFAFNCGMESSNDVEFWKTQHELLNPRKCPNQATTPKTSSKPCRYGTSCTKPKCPFLHDLSEMKSEEPNGQEEPIVITHWLPPYLDIKLLEDGKLDIKEKSEADMQSEEEDAEKDATSYALYAVVNSIRDPCKPEFQNLSSSIKVGANYHRRTMGGSIAQWYIFNDFVVVPISLDEVLSFDSDWKLPCVLYFTRTDILSRHSIEVINPITQDIFLNDKSLDTRNVYRRIKFTPLSVDEMPSEGDVVAMDAEFVSLNQEESELRSDGTRSTIKPQQMAVARVTCVRGKGPSKGVPFIDDYISTQEQVVDYLTKFSGIMPGDLDVSLSSKHLTTLKSTYVKLRYLVDHGIKFVGHGLKTDFRVINLVVPPEQVIDTVYLFHQQNQRMISLRFLAWHFLGLQIQSIIHDSIEDARTAFELHEKHEELESNGETKAAIKNLYEKGRNLQWKVPGAKD